MAKAKKGRGVVAIAKKATGGRPRLPAAEKKKQFGVKLSPEEILLVKRAAILDADKPYTWGRRMLIIAARQRLLAAGIIVEIEEKSKPPRK
jgi:hypothetical protein